ncbi:class I SAM-dependent methyltransferase [Pantanalinema sp. GBBB05]|uniref:class I SAM-dependent methyltransferase n=1 Tax=Pantanalinema sp. GBBB05 TaxID=2604139 RepID=UPI001DC0E773|nr:class I SAM-dependent methyltransferase [Pantanalinema sp. GBBB05]
MSQNEAIPLHTMQPLTRFSNRAEAYAQYRPSYPEATIATILAGLDNLTQPVAADIGAGTGIASRLLAEQGVQVWAVEPNQAMQQVAIPYDRVRWQTATAEATGLPDRSMDLVTCFQAFHWFDADLSLLEFHRILKPGGRLALVWNNRVRDDGFTASYSQLIQVASGNHPAEKLRDITQTCDQLTNHPFFMQVRQTAHRHQQAVGWAGLLGRVQSTSYLPQAGESYEQLVTELRQLYQQWADAEGLVYLTYSTDLFLAETVPSSERL